MRTNFLFREFFSKDFFARGSDFPLFSTNKSTYFHQQIVSAGVRTSGSDKNRGSFDDLRGNTSFLPRDTLVASPLHVSLVRTDLGTVKTLDFGDEPVVVHSSAGGENNIQSHRSMSTTTAAAAHLELVFSAANSFALAGWCCLALALLWPTARRLALAFASLLAPCLLAALYAYLLGTGLASGATGSFGSLAGVRQLFANDTVLLVRGGQRPPYRII
jgi:hypothetical protein